MLRIAEYRNVFDEDGKSIKREKINLKELEKFGFNGNAYGFKNAYVKYLDNYDYEYNIVYVMKKDRTIRLGHYQNELRSNRYFEFRYII